VLTDGNFTLESISAGQGHSEGMLMAHSKEKLLFKQTPTRRVRCAALRPGPYDKPGGQRHATETGCRAGRAHSRRYHPCADVLKDAGR
jgi:hypothetical protein